MVPCSPRAWAGAETLARRRPRARQLRNTPAGSCASSLDRHVNAVVERACKQRVQVLLETPHKAMLQVRAPVTSAPPDREQREVVRERLWLAHEV